MKNIFSDIAMGGLFLLILMAAHSAFSASSLASADQKIDIHKFQASILKKNRTPEPKSPKKIFPEKPLHIESATTSASSRIKSYKQWKSDQIQAAIHRVVVAKIIVQKAAVPKAHQQLAIEELGLNAAKSLTLKDYIAMYLGTQPNRQMALVEGAKLLSPDEVQMVLQELASPTLR
jgi:hypothetical protein